MQETEYKRLIQSAVDGATLGFVALIRRALQDAERDVVQKLADAKSAADRDKLRAAHRILQQDGNEILERIDTLYRVYLDRAVQTMYVDFRPGMQQASANEWTLIDDEVVNQQIEIGRLAQKMRQASEENIGRLNVIIAQLHGKHEARERENPFRPYLLARAVYEAIVELTADEPHADMLFQCLSGALIGHLAAHYIAICEVFDVAGVHGSFQAVPSSNAFHYRNYDLPGPSLARVNERTLAGLQRLLDAVQHPSDIVSPSGTPAQAAAPLNLEDAIVRMFRAPNAAEQATSALQAVGTGSADSLIGQLSRLQKEMASPETGDGQHFPAQRELFDVREGLDLGQAGVTDKLTIDVTAMLFEYIQREQRIPDEMRRIITGLQIPAMKAALQEPAFFRDEKHPLRVLLNRLCAAATGLESGAESGPAIYDEVKRIVRKVQDEFDAGGDMAAICGTGAQELEQFMTAQVQRHMADTADAIAALEISEKTAVLLANVTSALANVLLPLNLDTRITDFLIRLWPTVLVQSARDDAENGVGSDHPSSLYRQHHATMLDLAWSVQEKQTPSERSALVKLLPGLVKRINAALALVQLPEPECRHLMDQLVALHTEVLKSSKKTSVHAAPDMETLRAAFSTLVVDWEQASWTREDPPQVPATIVTNVFKQKSVTATVLAGEKSFTMTKADREFLSLACRPGARFECQAGESAEPMQLAFISQHRALYLFRRDRDKSLVVHDFASLLQNWREGTVIPCDSAPVFERAIESLLQDAKQMQAGSN